MPYPYRHVRPDGLVVESTRPEHAEPLEALQVEVFPTLLDEERFKAPHYLKHLELFPEGQFVVTDGDRVVGMTSTVRLEFDFDHTDHTFADVIQGGWLTSHEPAGSWLYGADVGTDPAYRRRGIARSLYEARHGAVRDLGLAGQVTVGMLSGFAAARDRMSLEDYHSRVVRGELYDPTVSTQMKMGFRPQKLMRGYLSDPVCDDSGVLLVLDADREVGVAASGVST